MNKRKAALAIPDKDREQLEAIARSRIESASRVQRAKILLMYAKGEKIINITRQLSTTRPLVYRAIDKALAFGALQSLADLQPREELVERIYQGIDEINNAPVVFRWQYKMDEIVIA